MSLGQTGSLFCPRRRHRSEAIPIPMTPRIRWLLPPIAGWSCGRLMWRPRGGPPYTRLLAHTSCGQDRPTRMSLSSAQPRERKKAGWSPWSFGSGSADWCLALC